MYARSTTIAAHPSFIDAGITHIRDTVMPTLADMDGCAGLSLLVDRDTGCCIATSSWLDEESLRRSEGRVRDLRDRVLEMFHASASVSRWDIEALHRDHRAGRGACARVVWLKLEPGRVDRAVDVFKLTALPATDDVDGFCSIALMADHAAGLAVVTTTFDSRAAMDRVQGQGERIRDAISREMDASVVEVREFDLEIAHLHVPEMA